MAKQKRIICVGDVHGEITKLQELFNKISLRKSDKIIFLGDYIDRGENSCAVIDFVINLREKYDVTCIAGNHEMMAIDTFNRVGSMAYSWMMNGGYQCLESYDGECATVEDMFEIHGDFFNDLKLYHEEDKYIFVHGYLDSEKDLEDQNEFSMLWSRFDQIKPHKSGKIVVCGHTIQRGGVNDMDYKICIDTGSFLPDGYITAMVIDGEKIEYIKSE